MHSWLCLMLSFSLSLLLRILIICLLSVEHLGLLFSSGHLSWVKRFSSMKMSLSSNLGGYFKLLLKYFLLSPGFFFFLLSSFSFLELSLVVAQLTLSSSFSTSGLIFLRFHTEPVWNNQTSVRELPFTSRNNH